MNSSIRSVLRTAVGLATARCLTTGFLMTASVAPANAKSYSGERGAWEGPIYVANATAKHTTSASFKKAVKRSGYAQKSTKPGKKYAALGKTANDATPYKKSVTGGGVRWAANSGCLSGSLKSVISQVAANYGPVTVSSTCRSRGHNAAVGGAKKSYHLSGSAADFRVHGNAGATYAFLRSSGSVGGLKHYGGGLFHIDTGPRRAF